VKQEEIRIVCEQLRKAIAALVDTSTWPGFACGLTEAEFIEAKKIIAKEGTLNPWFTEKQVYSALNGIAEMLENQSLQKFTAKYEFASRPKTIAVIMAGNIPLVGFHDLVCVLITGHNALCKLSSSDNRLLPMLCSWMFEWNPALKSRISFSFGPIKNYDAVIATGSDNTINQFESYFGKVPHVFRRNRTSIAVLDGSETDEELNLLAEDIFMYFGMGCRNVSKLFVPDDFNLDRIFENSLNFSEYINHHKYGNNYDYNRTVYLMNQIPFLDNNVFLLKEDEGIHAPLAVVFYERYSDVSSIERFIQAHEHQLQVVVGHTGVPFGQAQHPRIDDFADNIDTCIWLNNL
jgi:hypothetical protein